LIKQEATMKDISVQLRMVTFLLLLVAAVRVEAASVVTSGGLFYQYTGPVGYPIYKTPSGPQRDNAESYVSVFRDGTLGGTARVTPADPYPGYEASKFEGAGTAVVSLIGYQWVGTTVQFWNEVNGIREGSASILSITGNTTPGVTIDPATGKSDLFKLATIFFTNGNWFSVGDSLSPPYDPGYGPLYPESLFDFSLNALPDPFIGNSAFPGRHVVNDALVLRSTFGAGTPDNLYIRGNPQLGVIAVAEGVTGSVELWGRIGSLELEEFRNPSSGVTLLPPIETPAVPAPPTLWLLGAGLLATAGALRGRRETKDRPR
jgi:hypothetical protein